MYTVIRQERKIILLANSFKQVLLVAFQDYVDSTLFDLVKAESDQTPVRACRMILHTFPAVKEHKIVES